MIPAKNFQEKVNDVILELCPLVDDGQSFICHMGVTQVPSGSMVFVKKFQSIRMMKNIWRLNADNSKLWLSHSYLISNAAAKNILNLESEISVLTDDWSRRIDKGIFQHIFYSASFFKQDLEIESQIGNSRFSSGLNPLRTTGIKEKIKRMIPQVFLFYFKFILSPNFNIISVCDKGNKDH